METLGVNDRYTYIKYLVCNANWNWEMWLWSSSTPSVAQLSGADYLDLFENVIECWGDTGTWRCRNRRRVRWTRERVIGSIFLNLQPFHFSRPLFPPFLWCTSLGNRKISMTHALEHSTWPSAEGKPIKTRKKNAQKYILFVSTTETITSLSPRYPPIKRSEKSGEHESSRLATGSTLLRRNSSDWIHLLRFRFENSTKTHFLPSTTTSFACGIHRWRWDASFSINS